MPKNLSPQLALILEPTQDETFSSFCWGDNDLLKQALFAFAEHQSTNPFFYLWGPEGTGKSHLLQATCLHVPAPKTAIYLPLKLLKPWGPAVLENIEHQSLIAIDDIDAIAGDSAWEEALFHLMNTLYAAQTTRLILSSREAPSHSTLKLPDLKSRLHWCFITPLSPLTDEQKIATLQQYAHQRGFELSDTVAHFLIHRFDRNMHNLIQLLKKLDHGSLAAQRKITLPFVKQLLLETRGSGV